MTSRFATVASLGALVSAAFALVAGCTLTPNNGSDAGVHEAAASTGTIGGQCTRIESAYCQHAINDCLAPVGSLSQCVADGQIKCCSDKCGNPAKSPDTAVDTCVAAIAQESCNDIVNGGTPASCAGVPKLQ